MGDEIAAALGRTGVDGELARDVIAPAWRPSWPVPEIGRDGSYVNPWAAAFALRDQGRKGLSGRTFNLSDADSLDMAKVAATELWITGSRPSTRSSTPSRIAGGKYASVQEMLNQPNQFSKITSRAPASLRRRRQHAPMPGDAFLSDWNRLAWRRDGRRAQLPQPSVLRSAQPRRLGQRGRGAEARYGVGNIAQYNGTAPGQLPVPPFNLNLGAGATGLQAIANQLAQNVAPELTKFTTTLASADGGLGQFSSSIASAAKSLLGDLFKSVSRGGFAEGSLISGDGTGTSRAMRDRASSFRRSGHDAEPTRTSPWSLTTSTSSAPARRPSTRALLDAIIQGEPPGSRPPLSLPSPTLSPARPTRPAATPDPESPTTTPSKTISRRRTPTGSASPRADRRRRQCASATHGREEQLTISVQVIVISVQVIAIIMQVIA